MPDDDRPAAVLEGPDDGALVRTFLANHDYPCPRCGYNLRDCAATACPECGNPLTVQIGQGWRLAGPWITGLLALALPLGFNVIFACIATYAVLRSATWYDDDWILLIAGWGASALLAGAIAVAVVGQRRFQRRSRPAQWRRALLTIVLATMLQSAVLVIIRATG